MAPPVRRSTSLPRPREPKRLGREVPDDVSSDPCEPGKVFEFSVEQNGKATSTWRYEIVATDDGVDVTESFRLADMLPLKMYWAVMGWSRGKTNRNGMRTTLERIKAVAEEA